MRSLVTGGVGVVGSHFTDYLLAETRFRAGVAGDIVTRQLSTVRRYIPTTTEPPFVTGTDDPETALDPEELRRIRRILDEHGVHFAMLFGSAANPSGDPADVDLAVEFADRRPSSDGYASAYLQLYGTLQNELDRGVDLVDVHSLSPPFASVVLDGGIVVLGSDERRANLADRLADDGPSTAEARERVAAAAARLREGSS